MFTAAAVVALLALLGPGAAQAEQLPERRLLGNGSCRYANKNYADGTIVSNAEGQCTCTDGEFTNCMCFNVDRVVNPSSMVPVGQLVFKVSEACRCLASDKTLVDTRTGCLPLRPNALTTGQRGVTEGADWGFNFDPALGSKVLNGGNHIGAFEAGMTSVLSVVPACSSTPHWHPRATELYIVPSGTMNTFFAEESLGKLYVQNIVGPGLSYAPRGLLHTLVNPTCSTINIFVVYNSADQGRVNAPGIDCANPPTGTDGPSLLVQESCRQIAACKATCGLA